MECFSVHCTYLWTFCLLSGCFPPLVKVLAACLSWVMRKRDSVELSCSVGQRCPGGKVKTKTADNRQWVVIQIAVGYWQGVVNVIEDSIVLTQLSSFYTFWVLHPSLASIHSCVTLFSTLIPGDNGWMIGVHVLPDWIFPAKLGLRKMS